MPRRILEDWKSVEFPELESTREYLNQPQKKAISL